MTPLISKRLKGTIKYTAYEDNISFQERSFHFALFKYLHLCRLTVFVQSENHNDVSISFAGRITVVHILDARRVTKWWFNDRKEKDLGEEKNNDVT